MSDPPRKTTGRLLTGPDARNLKAHENKSGFAAAQVPLGAPSFTALTRHRNTLRLPRIVPSRQQLLREIALLRERQEPIGRIFWALEKAIARRCDELERRAS